MIHKYFDRRKVLEKRSVSTLICLRLEYAAAAGFSLVFTVPLLNQEDLGFFQMVALFCFVTALPLLIAYIVILSDFIDSAESQHATDSLRNAYAPIENIGIVGLGIAFLGFTASVFHASGVALVVLIAVSTWVYFYIKKRRDSSESSIYVDAQNQVVSPSKKSRKKVAKTVTKTSGEKRNLG